MALTVSFGNGGSASTTNLLASNAAFQTLTGPSVTSGSADGNNVGQVINGTQQTAPSVAVAGSGTGGKVDVGFTDNTFTFDVSTAWNSVKNAYATNGGSAAGEKVSFTDFVQVDVDFGSATGASVVEINDVKRANVTTGSGNDTIAIKLATNDAGWQNIVNVNAGGGDDSITIGRGSVSDSAKAVDGSLTNVTINAGAGNDTIDLSGVSLRSSTVNGGIGNDTITLSGGADTVVIGADNGSDVINNFEVGKDTLSFDGVQASVIYTEGSSTFYKINGGGYLTVNNSVLIG